MVHTMDSQNLTQIHNQSLIDEVEDEDIKQLWNTSTEEIGGSQLDPSFFQDDNNVQKKKKQQRNIKQKPEIC